MESVDRVLEAGDRWGTSARVLSNIVAGVLEFAKKHQEGRATGDLASATFSEYWFRTNGLYEILPPVLTIARGFQIGRGNPDLPGGNSQHKFQFSEYWFRISGLYEIVTGVLECAREHQEGRVTSEVLNEIVTEVLEFARTHQQGRVTKDVTAVTFSERWFRDSGLYEIVPEVWNLRELIK